MFKTDNQFYFIPANRARQLPKYLRFNLVFIQSAVYKHGFTRDNQVRKYNKELYHIIRTDIDLDKVHDYEFYLHNLTGEDLTMLVLLDIIVYEADKTTIIEEDGNYLITFHVGPNRVG